MENYCFKLPIDDNCTDYWTISHYQMKDIQGLPPNEQ